MHVAHPLVFVAALAIPWIWWTARRAGARVELRRLWLRTITVVLLVLAASGVNVRTQIGRAHV